MHKEAFFLLKSSQQKLHPVLRDFDLHAIFVAETLKLSLHISVVSSNDCRPAVGHNHFWNAFFPTPSQLCLYGGVAEHLMVSLLVTDQRARNGCAVADVGSDP